MQTNKKPQAKSEVLVVFADIEARDLVASYARNLAPFVDETNKPTAGLRPDIPSHLGGVHRTLLQYGYAMKWRYGDKFRRNIRFEDGDLTLVIDVCIPDGIQPGKEWTTVNYEHAVMDRKANNKDNVQEHADRLASKERSARGEQGGAIPKK